MTVLAPTAEEADAVSTAFTPSGSKRPGDIGDTRKSLARYSFRRPPRGLSAGSSGQYPRRLPVLRAGQIDESTVKESKETGAAGISPRLAAR